MGQGPSKQIQKQQSLTVFEKQTKLSKGFPKFIISSKIVMKQSKRIYEFNQQQKKENDQIFKRIFITDQDRNKGQKHLFQKYCQIFELEWKARKDDQNFFGNLREKYRQISFEYSQDKNLRKCINQAYELLTQKLFGIKYSEEEKKLILAILHENQNQINKMLYQNPRLIDFRLKEIGYPLIYLAVRTGSYQITKLLLSKSAKFDFSQDKSTPMHCASYYGHKELILLLVEHGVPLNIKNSCGNLAIQQAKNQQIRSMIQKAQKDQIHQFTTKLTNEGLCLKTFNIQDKFQVIAKKIILKSYERNFDNYVDAFHGTKFQNFFSIAKYGLKKPGQKAGDQVIEIVQGHIEEKKWSDRIFLSPSIFYSGCPVYARKIQFLNTTKNKTDAWLPILQVKVKKGSYETYKSTTPQHVPLKGQPQQIEYIVQYDTEDQAKDKLCVVGLIFVKAFYLKSKKVYHQAIQILLNSQQQKMWRKNMDKTQTNQIF